MVFLNNPLRRSWDVEWKSCRLNDSCSSISASLPHGTPKTDQLIFCHKFPHIIPEVSNSREWGLVKTDVSDSSQFSPGITFNSFFTGCLIVCVVSLTSFSAHPRSHVGFWLNFQPCLSCLHPKAVTKPSPEQVWGREANVLRAGPCSAHRFFTLGLDRLRFKRFCVTVYQHSYILFKWLWFTAHRSLMAQRYNSLMPRFSNRSMYLAFPVVLALMFCLQHLRIYGGAILTSTRGLWTPVKCYFVQPSKWSDHKPSNRGINSQYWPVFSVAACSHGISSKLRRQASSPDLWLKTEPSTSYSTTI